MPGVALRLMTLLTREDWQTREVVELTSGDPALVVDILNAANRTRRGGRLCETVGRAAVVIGSTRLHSVCLASAIRQLLGVTGSGRLLRECWRHSRAVAVASQALAPAFELNPSRAHSAGLLHNVGLLALLADYTEEYEDLLAVSPPDDASILAAEKSLFDLNHCEAGTWLCSRWSLPAAFEEVVAKHHTHVPSDSSLLSLVVIAARAAESAGYNLGRSESPIQADLSDVVALALSDAAPLSQAQARRFSRLCLAAFSSDLELDLVP